jgi:hypothetical protein
VASGHRRFRISDLDYVTVVPVINKYVFYGYTILYQTSRCRLANLLHIWKALGSNLDPDSDIYPIQG